MIVRRWRVDENRRCDKDHIWSLVNLKRLLRRLEIGFGGTCRTRRSVGGSSRGIRTVPSYAHLKIQKNVRNRASQTKQSGKPYKPFVKEKLLPLIFALLFLIFTSLSFYVFKTNVNDVAVISAWRVVLGLLFFAGQCAGYFNLCPERIPPIVQVRGISVHQLITNGIRPAPAGRPK